jgi:UDP-N-acetylglucosamine acyltransferase
MAIHPTAVVDSRAEIDPSAEIGAYAVIDANARIGADCVIHHHGIVTGWTELGAGCAVHSFAVIGGEPQDTRYKGERSYCRVGPGTVFREHVTVHRGTQPDSETLVGSKCFLMAHAHIGHNCVIGDHVTMVNGAVTAGHVTIGNRVLLGAMSGVHQFCTVGEVVLVATATVRMDVPPFLLVDDSGECVGVNVIGMRRAGRSHEEIDEIRQAYRKLYRSGKPFRRAAERLAAEVTTDAGRVLTAFLERDHPRGVIGSPRGARNRARG